MKSIALLFSLALFACTNFDDAVPPDGGFNGDQIGCGSFVVARGTPDSLGVLLVHDELIFIGDTQYTADLAGEADLQIRRFRYQIPLAVGWLHCRTDGFGIITGPSLAWDAVKGAVNVTVWAMPDSDTAARPSFVGLELRDVVFEDGFRIDSLDIDSIGLSP